MQKYKLYFIRKNIESYFKDNEGSFSFSYDIDVNGALTSENEVKVTVKVN